MLAKGSVKMPFAMAKRIVRARTSSERPELVDRSCRDMLDPMGILEAMSRRAMIPRFATSAA